MSAQARVLPYGDRALLVELGDTQTAIAWAEAVRETPPSSVVDLVPGAQTVLVVAAPGTGLDALRDDLSRVQPATTHGPGRADETVEIEVVYDGPDLTTVADLTGLGVAEVVRAHTTTPWRVAFGGFAPGFAYLAGGDERLSVPRRDEARTQVPAGSVGLAGEFSGVYPSASPGGWQVIGTTDAVMWDLDRDPPALLRPGAWVRFVDAGEG